MNKSIKLEAVTEKGIKVNLSLVADDKGLTLDYNILNSEGIHLTTIEEADDPFHIIRTLDSLMTNLMEHLDAHEDLTKEELN